MCFITDEHEVAVAAGGAAQADSPPPLVDFGDDPNFSQDSDGYFEPDTGLLIPAEAEGK